MRLPRWQRQCGPDMTRPASWVVSPSPRAFVVEGLNPGFPHPGEHFLLHQNGQHGLPKTRPDLDGGPVTGFPNPSRPAPSSGNDYVTSESWKSSPFYL